MIDPQLVPVLAAYGSAARPSSVESVASAESFSGAHVWRLATPLGRLALRAWPSEFPTPPRLTWIHRALAHAARGPLRSILPVPLQATAGDTYIAHAGRLWELEPWLAGEPVGPLAADDPRLAAAFTRLAQFHQAIQDFHHPCPDVAVPQNPGLSPGLAQRREQLANLLASGAAQLRTVLRDVRLEWPEFQQFAVRWFDHFQRLARRCLTELLAAADHPTRLAPCLRDIKRDHVLFTGQEVTGLVDFGSLRPDSVAADLSRLLASLAQNDPAAQSAALRAYEQVRVLTNHEHWSLPVFDLSGHLLAGANWIDWIAVQKREFAMRRAVESRFQTIDDRLGQFRAAQPLSLD